jgi:predicted nucleic acid-binding protein
VRRIVCDTGPLLHLTEANALELVALAGKVHIPESVDAEMSRHVVTWAAEKPTWVRVERLARPYEVEAEAWGKAGLLDPGEAQAIALARQMNADWLLTDDAPARLVAQALSIEVHGSLGIVLWAGATDHLTRVEAESLLDRLAGSSLWISAGVLAEAKEALNKMFSSRKP